MGRTRRRTDAGFLLAEALVAVLVVGILAGISLPAASHVLGRASDMATREVLSAAVSKAALLRSERPGLVDAGLDALPRTVAGFRLTRGASDGPTTVSLAAVGDTVAAAVRSDSGRCWRATSDGVDVSIAPGSDADPCQAEIPSALPPP